jgi:hypothetical protein
MASSPQDLSDEDAERPVPDSLLLKPTDAAKWLGVGRQFMYDLIRDGPNNGGVASIRLSRKILVPRRSLEDWVTMRIQEAKDA